MSKLSETDNKTMISGIGAVLFIVLSLPMIYDFVNKRLSKIPFINIFQTAKDGCPTYAGIILHSVVFFGLLRLLLLMPMAEQYKEPLNKPHFV